MHLKKNRALCPMLEIEKHLLKNSKAGIPFCLQVYQEPLIGREAKKATPIGITYTKMSHDKNSILD